MYSSCYNYSDNSVNRHSKFWRRPVSALGSDNSSSLERREPERWIFIPSNYIPRGELCHSYTKVMSTSLQGTLMMLQKSNCASLAIATAVGYDYVLTFSSEIEYVWKRPWSCVSFLFILVRYLGCYSAIATSLNGTTFMPGPGEVSYTIYLLNQFAYLLFLAAADMVMILRVWAIYNRSRLILVILLMIFIPYIIATTIVTVITNVPKNVETAPVRASDFSFCCYYSTLYTWTEAIIILQLIPGAVTCALMVIQFVRQSLQMYRAMNQWRLNHYVNLLCREGILYFLVTLAFGLVNLPPQCLFDPLTLRGLPAVLFVACNVPVFTLTPRFILSIRALYAHDLRYRTEYGIDTGFGLSSPSNLGAGGTAIVFADDGRSGESGDEEMAIEGEGDSTKAGWWW